VYGKKNVRLPFEVGVWQSTALLEALFERVAELGELNGRRSVDRSLALLIENELSTAEEEPLGLIFPTSPPLRKVAEQIFKEGRSAKKLSAWAKGVGMSERSFSRHFHREVGLSFDRWRSKAIHHKAIQLIGQGESVTSTAFSLGYESVSAFIASFRREYGSSPTVKCGHPVNRRKQMVR
jgi:AraC-like DNA-binding protein